LWLWGSEGAALSIVRVALLSVVRVALLSVVRVALLTVVRVTLLGGVRASLLTTVRVSLVVGVCLWVDGCSFVCDVGMVTGLISVEGDDLKSAVGKLHSVFPGRLFPIVRLSVGIIVTAGSIVHCILKAVWHGSLVLIPLSSITLI